MLHIINNTNILQNCLATTQADDHILLIENGVLDILTTNFSQFKNIHFYALEADINARGLQDKIPTNLTSLNYEEFVELTVKYFPIRNWTALI